LSNTILQHRYASLFSGVVLCITGLAILAYLSPNDLLTPGFVRDGMLIQSQQILPNEPISEIISVTELNHDISIFVNRPTSEIQLKAEIKDPNGMTVRDVDISKSSQATFRPEILGKYTVTITNVGSKATIISAYHGHHLPETTSTNTETALGYLWIPLIIGGSYLIVHTNFKVLLRSGKNLN